MIITIVITIILIIVIIICYFSIIFVLEKCLSWIFFSVFMCGRVNYFCVGCDGCRYPAAGDPHEAEGTGEPGPSNRPTAADD